MSNLNTKGAVINLDKERHILFDLNALCEIEDKYGDIYKAISSLSSQPKMNDIRYMLYVGLCHEDDNLTDKKVGKLITLQNVTDVIEAVGKAMDMSLPDKKEESENDGKNV